MNRVGTVVLARLVTVGCTTDKLLVFENSLLSDAEMQLLLGKYMMK